MVVAKGFVPKMFVDPPSLGEFSRQIQARHFLPADFPVARVVQSGSGAVTDARR